MRSTRAIIDLDAIAGNVRVLIAALPAGTGLMAVVKADGYGHGAPWVANAALEAGALALGVATVGEGRTLRAHEIGAPIVLLSAIDPSEVVAACEAGLEITVAEEVLLDAVQGAARTTRGGRVAVHIKIDTGLRRYGAMPEHAVALASRISADDSLRLAGVSTHFASADEPAEPFTAEQLRRFDRVIADLRAAGIEPPTVHAANSAAILTGQGVAYGMARGGIALYGVRPAADVPLAPTMRPVMRLESRIARIVPLSEGDSVGYNRTFRAPSAMTGALVPIGYADGYRRALSGKAWVGVGGRACRVLGRVSMDQIVVAIPSDGDASVGDSVHILGGDPATGAPSVDEIAELAGTNSYEILVGISQRVPRVFVKNGEVIATRDIGGNASGSKTE
jgi:alanine racemase